MIELIIRNISRFIILVLTQVLILNNVQLGGYLNPYLYILFILLLPVEIPGWLLLTVSFITGLSIDVFSNTTGIHASACVFLAFCRPYILKVIAPRDGYETDAQPTIQEQGLKWFIAYSVVLILLHHFFLFYVEVFRFREFFSTFFRAVMSSLLTVLLVLISQFLFYKSRSAKAK